MNRIITALFALFTLPAAYAQVHHWRADRHTADERGTLTGTLIGGTAYAPGVAAGAFSFDGADDAIRFDGAPLPPPWTLTMWVRREDGAGRSASLFNDTQTAIKLEQWPNTRKVGITHFGVADYEFDYQMPAGRWVHLALTASSAGTALYLDGNLTGTLPQTVNLPCAWLGGGAGDRLKGRVDEVKIWNSALTPKEVRSEVSVAPFMVTGPREANPSVPDVVGAFNALTPRGEALAFRMGAGAPLAEGNQLVEASRRAHYQGIQRWERTGSVPYLFVTRSGQDVGYGNMLVVRMGSRDTFGERMRSNRLAKSVSVNATGAPGADGVVANINFDYVHAGSIQLCGDILAVALEDKRFSHLPEGRVAFYNVTNPAQPVLLPYSLDTDHKIGVVGLTRLPDGHFLLVLTWDQNQRLKFYRSNHTGFFKPGFAFQFHTELDGEGIGAFPIGSPEVHQSLSLVTQSDGRVFMIGAYNSRDTTPIVNGEDRMTLYHVLNWHEGGTVNVTAVAGEAHKYCSTFGSVDSPVRILTADVNADFLAGSGSYVSPSGELLFYACEHWNDGPGWNVRFVEFHHNKVARPEGAAHYPKAHAGGPYRVIEGSTIILSAAHSMPVRVKPWIELYDDDNFEGSSVMIDWDDYLLDDYQDFRELEWNDKASALRWFAPPGYSVILYDGDNYRVEGNEPSLSLTFEEWAGQIGNLSDESWDFDNDGTHVTSVRFAAPATGRVDQPLEYQWKLPEEDYAHVSLRGDTIAAAAVIRGEDGPFISMANLLVSQPGPFGALTDRAEAIIEVVNAEPVLSSMNAEAVPNTSGRRVRLDIDYKDPGSADTHTIEIDWGDGVSESFSGAAGGLGLVQEHEYADNDPLLPLETMFTIAVTVTDNDGAAVSGAVNFRVIWRSNTSTADGDNDGLPDYWEDTRLLTRSLIGMDDADGDGFSNLDEYAAGTDPMDASDHFALHIDRLPDGRHAVSFIALGISGSGYGSLTRRYRLENSKSLAPGSWQALPGYGSIAGQNQAVIHLDTAGRAFFRGSVWLE
jgi:Concanavalin A-like lectin/glucanases superfamily/Bacterial TSP3 repeat